jgi:hypothetical protein
VTTEIKTRPSVRFREIRDSDCTALAQFLEQGFGSPAEYYLEIMEVQRHHQTPEGFPKHGYLLEAEGGAIVGSLLMIASAIDTPGKRSIRCHLSSWCVHPDYVCYSTMFVVRALKHKDVTYLNLSAAPDRWPVIRAQGFEKYSSGQYVAIPALCRLNMRRTHAKVIRIEEAPSGTYEPFERDLLVAHENYGWISFWVATPHRSYPFVFKPHMLKGAVPGVQLLYCSDIADLVRFAAPIGLHLLSLGKLVVATDSNGAIPGLPGKYFPNRKPRWYKGPKPRLGDLAYTLPALHSKIF